ncbi:MAG: hypothetical protein Q9226_004265 [Calogaya cf. arnoldii]
MSQTQCGSGSLHDDLKIHTKSDPPQVGQTLHSNGITGDAALIERSGEALGLEHADRVNSEVEDRDSDIGSDQVTLSDSDDPESESSGYDSPHRCDCGYVSYDYGDSEDDESDYDEFGYRIEDDGFSRSYRHYVTCRANKQPFPLEKLPPELRRMVFRFAMPDDRFIPLHTKEYDWNDKYDGHIMGIDFDDDEIDDDYHAIPKSLFKVNKMIATEALAVLHGEVYFRMDVSPFGIRTGSGLTTHLESFENNRLLAQWKPFKTSRNYHLNIKSNAVRLATYRGDVYHDPPTYKVGAYKIKEWIRLVSGELDNKDIIQNLTITALCKCALKAARRFPKDESSIFDLFTPLKRIRLPNDVILSLHNDAHGQGVEIPCPKSGCLELSHAIEAHLGQLQGEPLSGQEAIWKDCKTLYRADLKAEKDAPRDMKVWWGHWNADIEQVWSALDGLYDVSFEEAVENFRNQLAEREKRREQRRIEAREQAREQGGEQGGEQGDDHGGEQEDEQGGEQEYGHSDEEGEHQDGSTTEA